MTLVPDRATTMILFLDLQQEIVKNSRTLSLERLTRNAGALAKLASLHKLPAFLSAVPPGGTYLPNIVDTLGGVQPRPRTQTTAFADSALTAALAATARKDLVLAGVASEVVVVRTALDALRAGYNVYVAVDACGGIDARTEDAAWRRIVTAGGVMSSATTLAAELTGDFTTDIGGATLGIMYETAGA